MESLPAFTIQQLQRDFARQHRFQDRGRWSHMLHYWTGTALGWRQQSEWAALVSILQPFWALGRDWTPLIPIDPSTDPVVESWQITLPREKDKSRCLGHIDHHELSRYIGISPTYDGRSTLQHQQLYGRQPSQVDILPHVAKHSRTE